MKLIQRLDEAMKLLDHPNVISFEHERLKGVIKGLKEAHTERDQAQEEVL